MKFVEFIMVAATIVVFILISVGIIEHVETQVAAMRSMPDCDNLTWDNSTPPAQYCNYGNATLYCRFSSSPDLHLKDYSYYSCERVVLE